MRTPTMISHSMELSAPRMLNMNRPLGVVGVDALGDRLERDATSVQVVSDVDQMPQAACKSIETPNH